MILSACVQMGVSKNRGGPPKSSILIGFSIIFTIHFGVPSIFGITQIFEMPKNSVVLSLDNLPPSWDSPPPRRRRKERGPTGVLARPQRCLGGVGCVGWWWPTGEKWSNWKQRRVAEFSVCHFEVLVFSWQWNKKTREICHICLASCL